MSNGYPNKKRKVRYKKQKKFYKCQLLFKLQNFFFNYIIGIGIGIIYFTNHDAYRIAINVLLNIN